MDRFKNLRAFRRHQDHVIRSPDKKVMEEGVKDAKRGSYWRVKEQLTLKREWLHAIA